MATLYLIVALVIAVLAVIFALQNSMLVTISFFSWTVTGSLSLVLLATLAIGVLIIGLLVLAPNLLKKTFKSSSQRKRIDALENEVSQHNHRKKKGTGTNVMMQIPNDFMWRFGAFSGWRIL